MSNIIQDLSPANTGALNIKAMLSSNVYNKLNGQYTSVDQKVTIIKILAREQGVIAVYVDEDGKVDYANIRKFTIL